MQNFSSEVQSYLKTLPISVQTAITESNAQSDTVERLIKRFCSYPIRVYQLA